MGFRIKKHGGFTLIELMIALVCVALVMGAIMRLFMTGYRQMGRTQRNVDAQLNAYLASETIGQQLRAISGTGQGTTNDRTNPFKCSACHDQCFSGANVYGSVLQGKMTNCTTNCHAAETPSVYDSTTNKFSDLQVESFVINAKRSGKTVHPLALYIRSNPAGEKNRRIDYGADSQCNSILSSGCSDVHIVERRSLYTRPASSAEDSKGRKVLMLRVDYGGGQVTDEIVAYAVKDVQFEYVRTLGENWQTSCYSDPSDPTTLVDCRANAIAADTAYTPDPSTPVLGAASDGTCIPSNPISNFDYDGVAGNDAIETLIKGDPTNLQSPQGFHPMGFRVQGVRAIVTTINDDATKEFTVVSFVRPRILNLRRFGGG